MVKNMKGWEVFIYRAFVLFTLGGLFIYKLAMKKAIEEMNRK